MIKIEIWRAGSRFAWAGFMSHVPRAGEQVCWGIGDSESGVVRRVQWMTEDNTANLFLEVDPGEEL